MISNQKNNGPTQRAVLNFLKSEAVQASVATIAGRLAMTEDAVKNALLRLREGGLALSTTGRRPMLWSAAPQKTGAFNPVTGQTDMQEAITPPSGSAASIHGTMPQA